MGKIVNILGERFGRLEVIEEVGRGRFRHVIWLCKCDCGAEIRVNGYDLRSGKQVSCGCYKRENTSLRCTTHGMSNTRVFKTWAGIIQRCNNPKQTHYKNYGGRGITVCEEWKTFEGFWEWAQRSGYTDELTIERIDVNGNYEPSNCKWIPLSEQARNTTRNRRIIYNGENLPMVEWGERLGMTGDAISSRVDRGYTEEEAVSIPQMKPQALRYIKYKGKNQTVAKWSRELNISSATIRRRIDIHGWSEEKALSTPTGSDRERSNYITFNGKTMNYAEWGREIGMSANAIKERLEKGWTIEEALTTPKGQKRN